jgi:hypothetical protein
LLFPSDVARLDGVGRTPITARNRALFDSGLFEWVRPKAGAVAFIKFKGPLTSEQLGEALAAEGVSIKPAYHRLAGLAGLTALLRLLTDRDL